MPDVLGQKELFSKKKIFALKQIKKWGGTEVLQAGGGGGGIHIIENDRPEVKFTFRPTEWHNTLVCFDFQCPVSESSFLQKKVRATQIAECFTVCQTARASEKNRIT